MVLLIIIYEKNLKLNKEGKKQWRLERNEQSSRKGRHFLRRYWLYFQTTMSFLFFVLFCCFFNLRTIYKCLSCICSQFQGDQHQQRHWIHLHNSLEELNHSQCLLSPRPPSGPVTQKGETYNWPILQTEKVRKRH